MKITAEFTERDMAQALKDAIKERIEDSQLISLAQAAELLSVSKPTVRALIGDWIDLGMTSPRVELRRVKQLIEQRRVRI